MSDDKEFLPLTHFLEEYLKRGADPALLVDAVRILELTLQRISPAQKAVLDEAGERRRAADRKRKAMLPSDWVFLTREVFERDGYRCTYCGVDCDIPHCDHVVPLSKGGGNGLDNLVTACAACNVSKGNKDLEEWKRLRQGRS